MVTDQLLNLWVVWWGRGLGVQVADFYSSSDFFFFSRLHAQLVFHEGFTLLLAAFSSPIPDEAGIIIPILWMRL